MAIGLKGLDDLQKEAKEKDLDFHKHVAAKALDKPHDEVTPVERNEAKTLLFAYNYGSKVTL